MAILKNKMKQYLKESHNPKTSTLGIISKIIGDGLVFP
jgi:hypothetical protein